MVSKVVRSIQEYNVLGTRPLRHDGVDKVTGRAKFGADIQLPGLLYGKILRSPHAHALIKSIDGTRALALPGVRALVTSAELPQPSGKVVDLGEGQMFNPRFLSNNCLAAGKVLYKGHAVVAVAATSLHLAEEALELIDVDYEVLPSVINVLDAMKKDAPVLHEMLAELENANIRPGGLRSDDDTVKGTNIANHFVFEIGDLEKGFAEADVIVEREFSTASVHQGYIEPQSATALWNADGNLTIWCSSQGHFNVRDQTARVIGIPVSKIRVIPMEIGGGFGGKTVIYLEPIASLLSMKTGRAVKLTMSRDEVFQGTGPTSGSYVKVKIGANNAGRITAAEACLVYEAGAFPGSPVNPASSCIFGPYDIPNARTEGYDVVLNKPKTAAYRAPGVPVAAFAAETVVNEVCEKIGMDPLDFRLLNGAREGTRRVTGPRFPRIGYLETIQAAKIHEHYSAPLNGSNRGRGVASGFWGNGTGPSSAMASVNADGTVSLVEGSPDIGGSRTAVAMQLAEVLGIAAEDVRPMVGDTDSVGFTSTTGGSGVAFKTGWACYEAAQDIKRQMVERAARIWEISADEVGYSLGTMFQKLNPKLCMSFKQLAGMLNITGGPICGCSNVHPSGVGSAFAVNIVDVEVDPETGKVEILRYTALQDVGKAIHPSYVEGQMQGGVAQGIGWALNEEYFFNEHGQMTNSSFLDYRMPTSLDLPMIDTVIVEVANPGHPYGVRGVGEISIVPPIAAVANAIYNAVGIRMTKLPMSPGSILEALWQKDKKRGTL
jgi:xanthine dehydrogenase molybdenum-binding subunit